MMNEEILKKTAGRGWGGFILSDSIQREIERVSADIRGHCALVKSVLFRHRHRSEVMVKRQDQLCISRSEITLSTSSVSSSLELYAP